LGVSFTNRSLSKPTHTKPPASEQGAPEQSARRPRSADQGQYSVSRDLLAKTVQARKTLYDNRGRVHKIDAADVAAAIRDLDGIKKHNNSLGQLQEPPEDEPPTVVVVNRNDPVLGQV